MQQVTRQERRTEGRHVHTLDWSVLRDEAADWKCDECNTSCQSACKTSCTVASTICVKYEQDPLKGDQSRHSNSKESLYRGRPTKLSLARV
ncbi:MAG: six-cysteine ranthipeptide SCIFF [Limnochordaceae bacterium]|nr:six-cysteine ranthipeptide SCIFF [Limnochordaceae bacterium]